MDSSCFRSISVWTVEDHLCKASLVFPHAFYLKNRNNKKINLACLFLIEVQLIYNIMLVSGVQHYDSVIYSFSDSSPF